MKIKKYFGVFLLSINIFSILISKDLITIVGTTNVHGEIDPCGWKKKPLGGLARKATILEQIKNENITPLVIDSGNLFFKKEKVEPGITIETAKVNAEVIMKSFNKMGCDAFSPGVKDFAGGKDYLLRLERKSNFPFISSNIAHSSNNKLIFDPYTIKNINGYEIGIIGLSSNFESEGVSILDPISSLNSIFNEVYNKSDVVILLLHAETKDEQLLNQIYNSNLPIDLILRSGARTRSSDGGSKIPTYIAGDRGKMLYKFELNLVDKENSFIDIPWCNNTIDRMNERLNKMKKGNLEADLFDLYKNDPTTLNRINNYMNQLEKANQLLENAINTISLTKIELSKTIFDKPDILKIVDVGKLKIKDLIGPILPSQIDSEGRAPGDPHYGHGH